MRILLVEDHLSLAANIGEYLSARQCVVDFAYDGLMGLHLATTNAYEVVILDISLPKLDGVALAQRLRGEAGMTTPILMLTARDTLDDKLQGFAAGADDYLTKPFELAELSVRIGALARRAQSRMTVLTVADLVFDTGRRTVERAGVSMKLSPTGLRILEILMRRSPNMVSRDEVAYHIWGNDPPDGDASLRVHIHGLRTAIDKPFGQPLLHTSPGIGYRIAAEHAR